MDVQWRDNCKSLGDRYSHILASQQWTDVTFQVDSKIFPAHKVILAGGSPVFESQLFGPLAEVNPVITVEDLDPDAFQILLSYIYTESADISSMEAAYKVYYAADKYMLPKLTALCVQYISTHLSATNVCKAYEFSKFYKNSDLEKKCVEILSRKTKEVLASDEFYEANISTVVELFDMPHLNIPSEMTLFVAAERYHSSHRGTAQLKGSSPTLTIHNAVEKIRFLTLSPQEFASSIRGTSLLSETDKFSLLMNISSSESGAPMPQGFSTSKQKRTLKSSEILSGKHYYILVSTEDQKLDEMGEMHEAYRGNIIICNTRNTVDLVGSHIVEYGYSEYYHYRDSTYNSTMQCVFEGMSQSNIQTAIRKHASDHSTLIIMASLIGKVKLTKEKCVILYDPPADAKDYPRFVTKNGLTVTLVTPQQQGIIQDIEDMHCVEMWRYDKVTEAIQNFYDSTS